MDSCLPSCSCDDNEGVTKADLDRYTDKLANVLNDEKGRRFFRNFMITAKLNDGKRALNLWEHSDRLLAYIPEEHKNNRNFLSDLNKLIDEAERVDDLDLATMEKLTTASESENVTEIKTVLKLLKNDIQKCMRREYSAFRMHFIPKK